MIKVGLSYCGVEFETFDLVGEVYCWDFGNGGASNPDNNTSWAEFYNVFIQGSFSKF